MVMFLKKIHFSPHVNIYIALSLLSKKLMLTEIFFLYKFIIQVTSKIQSSMLLYDYRKY